MITNKQYLEGLNIKFLVGPRDYDDPSLWNEDLYEEVADLLEEAAKELGRRHDGLFIEVQVQGVSPSLEGWDGDEETVYVSKWGR